MFRRLLFVGLLTGLVAVPASLSGTVLSGTHPTAKCPVGKAGHAGFPAVCPDRVGEVRGGPGPDITRVAEDEWGIIRFTVTFAKPLAHSATFTDTASVELWATGATTTKHYLLSVSAARPGQLVIRKLPDGKPIYRSSGDAPLYVSGKTAKLAVDLDAVLGHPSIVQYRVKASREMVNGHAAGVDYAPDTGTAAWYSYLPSP